jgi:hypothetical protein
MAIVTISSGAHWRNMAVESETNNGRDNFAHIFDPDEPEGVPQQAHNFITYAAALGYSPAPHILIAPEEDPDPVEQAHVNVMMADWSQIVSTATGVEVRIG